MRNKLTILVGIPGSGKTTIAKELLEQSGRDTTVIISRDTIRYSLHGDYQMGKEDLVTEIQHNMIESALLKYNVIVDDTNCALNRVKDFIERYYRVAEINLVRVDTSLEKSLLQNKQRSSEKVVPDEVIIRMYDSFVIVKKNWRSLIDLIDDKSKGLRKEPNLLKDSDPRKDRCIVVDLDGTLAIHRGRGPYEQDRVFEDDVNLQVLKTIRLYQEGGYKIVFLSGRNEDSRSETVRWLNYKVQLEDYTLIMRDSGDFRKDSIVKRELYEEQVEPHFHTFLWIDDRNQVVDMVRNKLGLPCWQVNYGNF